MSKIQGSIYLEKALHDKLNYYCNDGFTKIKNEVLVKALERFLLTEVEVENMTKKEIGIMLDDTDDRASYYLKLKTKLEIYADKLED